MVEHGIRNAAVASSILASSSISEAFGGFRGSLFLQRTVVKIGGGFAEKEIDKVKMSGIHFIFRCVFLQRK